MYKKSFNDGWTVKKVKANLSENLTGLGNTEELSVTLPHDAMIVEPRDKDNASGGACGFYPGGDYDYVKKILVPKEEKGKTYILEFEGIYNRGRVYVNKDFVGSVHYGYTRLILDITPYLRYGEENEILVKVTNSDVPNSRWYTGSGLYRPVTLYVGGPVRIGVDGLQIRTPEVAEDVTLVETSISLEYDGKVMETVRLHTTIKDALGNEVAKESTPVTVFAENVPKVKQRIYLKNVSLWSVEEPNLYHCEVKMMQGEEVLDETESTFGIRKITVDTMYGMRLNGKEVLLRGACIHHDNGPIGAATFARAEERRIEILKKAGFNALRMAHNPASKAMLDACDRIGMLVMEESFDMWNNAKSPLDYSLDFADTWEKDFEDIVAKDFNHPSVIMYSIGNEIQELGSPAGAAWNRKLAEKFRTLDPDRLVTNAMNGLLPIMNDLSQVLVEAGLMTPEQLQAMAAPEASAQMKGDINDVMTALMGQMKLITAHKIVSDKLEETYCGVDICGYNYMREAYDAYKERFPNQVYYGSETYAPEIDLNWQKVKEIPACIGDFTWTGWDYIGEAGVGIVTYSGKLEFLKGFPAYLAYCGDIDILGNRRSMSYYREIVFGLRKEPYIAVQLPEHYHDTPNCTPWANPYAVSSWSWPGYEGKTCVVEVYSDAEEVELLINGKSAGREKCGEINRFKGFFTVEYEPGEIKAIAYRNGKACESFEIRTPNEKKKLTVIADRKELKVGGQDLSYIDISITDENGLIDMSANAEIKVNATGAGSLIALASADPESTENFFDDIRTVYYGRVQAVVRSGFETGSIVVGVEAEGYEPVEIELNVCE